MTAKYFKFFATFRIACVPPQFWEQTPKWVRDWNIAVALWESGLDVSADFARCMALRRWYQAYGPSRMIRCVSDDSTAGGILSSDAFWDFNESRRRLGERTNGRKTLGLRFAPQTAKSVIRREHSARMGLACWKVTELPNASERTFSSKNPRGFVLMVSRSEDASRCVRTMMHS